MNKTIWGHAVVRNEENFVWFSIMSVIDSIDKLLIYDLGSTDNTVEIIKSIKNPKIILKCLAESKDMMAVAKIRQEMIDETKADWILVLDGDEIWTKVGIEEVTKTIEDNPNLECIVAPTLMLLGDVYHYQEELGGEYVIASKRGHFNLRVISTKIPGLHVEIHKNNKGLWREGYYDQENKLIYHRGDDRIFFLKTPYLHASHLRRSSKDRQVIERRMRFKYEIGKKMAKDFRYPDSFYLDKPISVPDPWQKMSAGYFARALVETPLKKIKRRVRLNSNES